MSTQVVAYLHFQRLYGNSSLDTSPQSCKSNSFETNESYVTVSTLINYGNGTSRWYNETKVPSGWDFYDLTVFLANCNVEARYYGPPLNEHYVTGINGVRNGAQFFWTLWVYCQKDRAWAVSPVGADLIKLSSGAVVAWYYQKLPSTDYSTWQPPVAAAKKVAACTS